MSVSSFVSKTREISLGDKPITVKPLTTRQVLELIDFFNQTKDKLQLAPEDVSFSVEYLKGLLEKLWNSLELTKDEKGFITLGGPAWVAFEKLAELLKVDAASFYDVSPDDIFSAAMALWEVNTSGPLGEKIRRIIDVLTPITKRIAKTLEETVDYKLRLGVIQGAQSGGMGNGGSTSTLPPSSENSAGPSDTSLTDSAPVNSLESTQALDTLTGTNPPSNGSPTNEEKPAKTPETPTKQEQGEAP